MPQTSRLNSEMTSRSRGQWAGLSAAVLFGCSAPLISTLTTTGSPLTLAGLLYGGAALMLCPLQLLKARQSQETPVQRGDWGGLVMLTLLGGVVGPLALVNGLTLLSPASSSLMLNLETVFTLLIAVLIGREHIGSRGVIAAALTISGALILSEGSLDGSTWQGGAWITLATLAWGIDNTISQRLSLRNPLQIAAIKSLGATVPMLGLAFAMHERFPSPAAMAFLLLIGALGYGLSIWLDLVALRNLGAAREAVLFAAAPFIGALFSVIVLQVQLTVAITLASLLMLIGMLVLLGEEHTHSHRHALQRHNHRHRHDPQAGSLHHNHDHPLEWLPENANQEPFWHAHDHVHDEQEHEHPHVSDAHHRHQH
ncbi:hypothetical protein SynWH8101_1323 [Synechococcus sp. WH 8101]|uniref:DMT family transporter n=1 Tax=Synechococcus sp. WH 8101 TaxID=59932 RepID=UPI0010233165|nr:DMT family transporter [Synechococcus sp. WH 8101]QBE68909.1 hypothetical protein SynWH8101_1323 [Synechococcus sp. WH 8101]